MAEGGGNSLVDHFRRLTLFTWKVHSVGFLNDAQLNQIVVCANIDISRVVGRDRVLPSSK